MDLGAGNIVHQRRHKEAEDDEQAKDCRQPKEVDSLANLRLFYINSSVMIEVTSSPRTRMWKHTTNAACKKLSQEHDQTLAMTHILGVSVPPERDGLQQQDDD